MTQECFDFPDVSNWRFDAIFASEPHRKVLWQDGAPQFLLAGVCDALAQALSCKNVRLALDYAERQPNDFRAVVQFRVGAELFDWFFNGRRGYRAHFRAHYECGLDFNCQLIDALRNVLDEALPDEIVARKVDYLFRDLGELQIGKTVLTTSLVPRLSKVWFTISGIGWDRSP